MACKLIEFDACIVGLAVAGAILQSLIRNPLASPDVIGISKGAGFAAAAVIFLFPQSPAYALPLAAFGGAVGTFLILLLLSRRLTLAGISVSAVGAIGFIGLMAPHMARRLVGSHNQWLIPLAALLGANLMLLGDILGRMLIVPREIPVGIMTALVGAPYFVYLLRRERSRKSF